MIRLSLSTLYLLCALFISSCDLDNGANNQSASVYSEEVGEDARLLDSSFYSFNDSLKWIVRNRDMQALKLLLANKVYESNNGCTYCTPNEIEKYFQGNSLDWFWESLETSIQHEFLKVSGIDPFSRKLNRLETQDSIYYVAPSFFDEIEFNCPDSLMIVDTTARVFSRRDFSSVPIEIEYWKEYKCGCNMNVSPELAKVKTDSVTWITIILESGQEVFAIEKKVQVFLLIELFMFRSWGILGRLLAFL